MNRCLLALRPLLPGLLCTLILGLMPLAVLAQDSGTLPLRQRIPPISPRALPGQLRIVQPPDVLLNGKPARLAPGARIRNRDNLLVVSGAVAGIDLPVRYTMDTYGLVFEVWILTEDELARGFAPPPMPPASSSN